MTNDIIDSMKKLIARYCAEIPNEIPNFNEFVIELTLRKVYIKCAIAVTYRKQLEGKSNYLTLAHIFGYQHYI